MFFKRQYDLLGSVSTDREPSGLISIVLCQESFMPHPIAVSICRRTRRSGAALRQKLANNARSSYLDEVESLARFSRRVKTRVEALAFGIGCSAI